MVEHCGRRNASFASSLLPKVYPSKIPRKSHETLLHAPFTRESCKIRRNIALDLCTYVFYLGGRFTLTRASRTLDNELAVHARTPRNPVTVSHTGPVRVYMIVVKVSRRNGAEISVEPEGKRRDIFGRGGLDEKERDEEKWMADELVPL